MPDYIRWQKYPWTSPWFRLKLFIIGIFGRKLACGHRGYCRGHVGTIGNVRIIKDA